MALPSKTNVMRIEVGSRQEQIKETDCTCSQRFPLSAERFRAAVLRQRLRSLVSIIRRAVDMMDSILTSTHFCYFCWYVELLSCV